MLLDVCDAAQHSWLLLSASMLISQLKRERERERERENRKLPVMGHALFVVCKRAHFAKPHGDIFESNAIVNEHQTSFIWLFVYLFILVS